MSYNKVILQGNLGKDPDLRYTPAGVSVCSASLATSDTWVDKQGAKQEKTEWHQLVIWGPRGDAAGKYWRKGTSVLVEGSITYEKWTDKEGIIRYSTKVKVQNWEFCGAKTDNQGQSGPRSGQMPAQPTASEDPFGAVSDTDIDQLPF